jgi:hypothetical protein
VSREVVHFREDGSCGASPSTEDEVMARSADFALRTAIAALTPKQQLVIQLRYGFWDGKSHSQEETSKLMRVSQQAVGRLEKRALIALREVVKMDDSVLVDARYSEPVDRSEVQMNTHKAHLADWRQDWELGVPTLRYIGDTTGWYMAPPCEGEADQGEEVVYVIHAKDVGKVKIGHTSNLAQRVRDLQVGSPVRLDVVRVYQIMDGVSEGSLHAKFANHRLHGEWFDDVVLEELD